MSKSSIKEKMQKQLLYGGAIECAIPNNFVNTSDIRQVPDHQEVFHELIPTSSSPRMIVFEILELQSNNKDCNEAVQYFFEDLADSNGATKEGRKIHTYIKPQLQKVSDGNIESSGCVGIQCVDYGNKLRQYIKVELLLLRMPDVQTDFLISHSIPIDTEEFEDLMKSMSSTVVASDISLGKTMLEICISFKVNDWGLFKC